MRNEIHLGWNLVFAFSDGYLLILLNLFVSLFIAVFISYLLHVLHLLILGGSLDGYWLVAFIHLSIFIFRSLLF